MVGAYLAPFRIPAAIIEAGSHAALNGLDDFLVFHLDAMQIATGASISQLGLPHVRVKRNLGAAGPERRDDVERQSPRVEVQHQVREQPEVKGRYSLPVIRMSRRQIESGRAGLGDSELQIAVPKSLRAVAGIIELLTQPGVHIRNVELFQIVVAVERPVRVDQIVVRRSSVAHELVERHPRDTLPDRSNPFFERHLRREPGEKKRAEPLERERRQIVLLGWKTDRRIELRHRYELSIESESAAMIAAPQ